MEELNPLTVVRSYCDGPPHSIFNGYDDQSREPSFHSWNSPSNKINRNSALARMVFMVVDVAVTSGSGTSRTISMSNTMKIIASRKNRSENGIRAVFLGSKPHSNGDDFSRSVVDRVLKAQAAANTASTRIRAIILNEDDAVM